jgi:hypothetical protein
MEALDAAAGSRELLSELQATSAPAARIEESPMTKWENEVLILLKYTQEYLVWKSASIKICFWVDMYGSEWH